MAIKREPEKMVYGRALLGRLHYVENVMGRSGLDEIFKKMIENGYRGPSHKSDIDEDKKYPFDYHLILLKSFKELYGGREFLRMSKHAPFMKGVVDWYVRFFKKPDALIQKVGEYWPRFYDFGDIQGHMLNGNRGSLVGKGICLSTPLFCSSLTGYFVGVCKVINLNAECKHTKCELKGDEISEWRLRW